MTLIDSQCSELPTRARQHSRVCAQITMYSMVGKSEVIVGPALLEAVRQAASALTNLA